MRGPSLGQDGGTQWGARRQVKLPHADKPHYLLCESSFWTLGVHFLDKMSGLDFDHNFPNLLCYGVLPMQPMNRGMWQ
jgi:hypothetical protein